jgi:hypothetical protein
MKILSWHDWLNIYIPYYESERHRNRFLDNPPLDILLISPEDLVRQRSSENPGVRWVNWETVNEQIEKTSMGPINPLFLERDTLQIWYWAFWKKGDALFVSLTLS